LKRKTIPKIAVLATGLAAALLVATIHPTPAQAFPSKAQDCTNCHGSGTVSGTVTAVPSTTTPAVGAAYTVAITMPANAAGSDTGYWIANSTAAGVTGTTTGKTGGAAGTAATSYTAAMTAPATAGTYFYKVWAVNGHADATGVANFALYSITVGGPPPTTIPPTTVPPTTVPPTTVPPTTVPPTTVPPTTVPPTTVPPTATASISKLWPDHGTIGTTVVIRGTGFGTPGAVKFGAVIAKAWFWTSTTVVVTVPAMSAVTVPATSAVTVPVWYRHTETVLVTVTPKGAAASNAVSFRLVAQDDDDDESDD